MPKLRFRPRKWISKLKEDLQRRMQIILFASFFAADVLASAVLFRIAPLDPVCIWYPNVWVYGMGHLVSTLLVVLVIAILWWIIGNPGAWESICRTRQRRRTLYLGGLAGAAIDLTSSIDMRYIPFSDLPHIATSGSILPWLLLRAVIWTVVYAAVGLTFLQVFNLRLRSRSHPTN